MSISTHLTRILTDRNTIREKLVEVGLAESDANLDDCAAIIQEIVNVGAVYQKLTVSVITYTIPKGLHDGTGSVSITLETKSVTPTKTEQKITPSTGKVLSEITVKAIPDKYQDVTGVTAIAAHVLDGDIFVNASGEKTEGTMPNNGSTSQTIDGLVKTSVSIPEGYTSGGTVSLTGDIENALAAI